MKNPFILLLAILAITACTTQPVDVIPTRYSQEVINARMSAWYNKDKIVGFPTLMEVIK